MVDENVYQEGGRYVKIQAVPSVYANGKPLHVGRGSLGQIFAKSWKRPSEACRKRMQPCRKDIRCRSFSVEVLPGPRQPLFCPQGLRVAVVAGRIGGQVKDGRHRNLISVPQTTGAQLADALRNHIGHYPIELFEDRQIEGRAARQDGASP